MIKVKIRKKYRNFVIPVPYAFLHFLSTILNSNLTLRMANKAIEKSGNSVKIPQLNKKDIQILIHVLSEQKGLRLLETKLKDGIEVTVTL
ncbi:MAG: hypothetical protein Q8934_06100 [Bacillota bacterium]|nr:hypothetical protein [Bacillota bacterium]